MEENNFVEIIGKAFDLGFWQGLTVTILVMLFILAWRTLRQPEVREAISYWFRSRAYKINESKIKTHPFFNTQPRLKYKIAQIEFPNAPYKTEVFKAFFNVKLMVDMEKVKEFVQGDYKDMDANGLFQKQFELIESMKTTFDERIEAELEKICEQEIAAVTDRDNALASKAICAREVKEYVMFEAGGYEAQRDGRYEVLIENMEMIRDSITFHSNNERNYYFLELLNSIITQSIIRADKVFKNFNGEIEKKFIKYMKKDTNM